MATNQQLEAVLAEYETFMHRLMTTHAPEVNAIDITMAQAKALYVVLAAGQLRMSELAAGLGVTSSTATGLVDRLVDMGLLQRGADPADRRQVVVTTTPAAESTLEHLRELNTRRMRELLGGMTSEDLAVVERAVAILSRALDADPASRSSLADPSAASAARRSDPQGDPS
jgi:DNA-binding MarR family transcriptional regulator